MSKKNKHSNNQTQHNKQGSSMTTSTPETPGQDTPPEAAPSNDTAAAQEPTQQVAEQSMEQAPEQAPEQQAEETSNENSEQQPTAAEVTAPVAPEIKVVTPVAKATTVVDAPLPTPTNDTGSFVNRMENLKVSGSSEQRSIVSRLERYVREMAPGLPRTPEQIVASQRGLWFVITSTLQKEHKEFNACFNIILDFFKAYENDAFGDRFVYRGAEYLPYDKQELAAFHQMVNLLKITCESKSRKHALQQVNLERTLADHFDEAARQKIIAFYQA